MIGKFINNYEVDEIIDEGGMSIVYLGIHKDLKRKVAIKMLNPILAKNPENRKRFKQEALTLSKLNHPNITALYDYVKNEDGYFIITEYVSGQTLEDYIDLVTGPMPETKAAKIFAQILEAISYIHSKNIIHRDIKPANILITKNNRVKLLDFGIAKSIQENSNLITKDGSKVGTTMFMSPQQIKGRVLDRRSDIYSLGATLFFILTGQFPFDKNETEYEIYNKIVNSPFPNPKTFYVGVSDKMCEIIEKATAKKPLDRFQTCSEFSVTILKSQTNKEKIQNINLQTKIIEAADIQIKSKVFSKDFLQNIIMLMTALIFTTTIAAGIFFLNKKDIRHVIAGESYLFAADSTNSSYIEKIYYGETVKILKEIKKNKKETWLKVYSLRNNAGYIQKDKIAVTHIYKQINEMMGNSDAAYITPAHFKYAMRNFYIENRLFDNNFTKWKLFAEIKKSYEYNTIAKGDFDDDNIQDFACLITNSSSNSKKLIIFFGNNENSVVIEMNDDVKLKTINKGKSGGRWFLGNTFSRKNQEGNSYEVKKHQYLDSDAILILKTETEENILYSYNIEEKMINFYNQSK